MARTTNRIEASEKIGRARRLVQARKDAGFSPAAAAEETGIKLNTLKGHESGRNGFSPSDALTYAKAYGTSEHYLLYGDDTVVHFAGHGRAPSKLAMEVDSLDPADRSVIAGVVRALRAAKRR